MRHTVKPLCKECDSCERVQYVRAKPRGEVHPLQIPERRDSIAVGVFMTRYMDLITELPVTKRGHDTIVVFVDHENDQYKM
jgi:hypothetical protein